MLRREAVSVLLGSCVAGASAVPAGLRRFMDSANGAALLVDVRTRGLIGVHGAEQAGQMPAPPGSTLKPLVLSALLKRGKLSAQESFACPAGLTIAGRSLNCSHPPIAAPMRLETALAYSCNCFVAHMAERFEPGELARELEGAGLASPAGIAGLSDVSGRIEPAGSLDAIRLQALGEEGVAVTLAELVLAYRLLALRIDRPEMRPIAAGLEGAVEFGTAQNARVAGVRVAGKTGSVRTAEGARIAWFAGFLPSRAPEVAVAVMLQGRSGGADAAPAAGRILRAYRAGRL